MTGLKDMALVERASGAVAVAEPPVVNIAEMFERLALNPEMPVDKLQALMEMQRSVLADRAKAAFASAFAEMQRDLPVIVERAKGHNDKKYAPLEDIVEVVRPILARHGFSLSHRTEWPGNGTVRIVGILAHRDGHERTSEFITGADKSGNKNDVQAYGSSMSYGRRYTTNDLLCIVTRGEDDDARRTASVQEPEGYDQWALDIKASADEGLAAFTKAWQASKPAFRDFLAKRNPDAFNQLKKRAAKVGAA